MLASLVALLTFSFVSSITPGPNNLMIAASGVNFGFKRSIPHFVGIVLGFQLMLALVCLGLGSVFILYPELQVALRYVGAAYLLYLAYRITLSSGVANMTKQQPLSFFEAALMNTNERIKNATNKDQTKRK